MSMHIEIKYINTSLPERVTSLWVNVAYIPDMPSGLSVSAACSCKKILIFFNYYVNKVTKEGSTRREHPTKSPQMKVNRRQQIPTFLF